MRSLLDNEGLIKTAQLGPDRHQLAEYRRIDLVVRELGRYNITVGALQETKWFWSAVYKVGCHSSWETYTTTRPKWTTR